MDDVTAATAFAALGNEHRVAVLRMLVRAGEGGLNVTTIREDLDLPPSTLAHHLRMLVDAGLVEQERIGRDLFSRPVPAVIRSLNAFLTEDCCNGVFPSSRRMGNPNHLL